MDLPTCTPQILTTSPSPSSPCPNCDPDLLHKTSQLLLSALAAASLDSPSTTPLLLRKHLTTHLIQRSQTLFLSHPDHSPPSDPLLTISTLINHFTSSQQTLLARFSQLLSPDARDEKIESLLREMEANCFWPIDRREALAAVLIKNIDFRNEAHCAMRFDDERALEEHRENCGFREVGCGNEGCRVRVCKAREGEHEAVCGFGVLECELKCGEMVLRREMDRHCVTVCGMRLVNCPFYGVGCETGVARCRVEEHCRERLRGHLVCVLRGVGCGGEDGAWEERAKELEEVDCFVFVSLLCIYVCLFIPKELETESEMIVFVIGWCCCSDAQN